MLTFRQFHESVSPLQQRLLTLRPKMAEAAQRVYDEWVSEDDDDFEGGICDEIASAIQEVIANNLDDAEITEGGHDGDDHAWTLVSDGKLVYEVDIPPHVYEHGSGYSWSKIEGVRFKSSDVIISKIDARRSKSVV